MVYGLWRFFLAMGTIEFAEQLNQPRHRFSNTGAMTVKAAELAFVRPAVASSVLGRARALVLSGLLACAVAAQADDAETSVDVMPAIIPRAAVPMRQTIPRNRCLHCNTGITTRRP